MQSSQSPSVVFSASSSLPFPDVMVLYDLCRYEKAFDVQQVSPWCTGFTMQDLEVMNQVSPLLNRLTVR